MSGSPLRLVVDTNVTLDLLLFDSRIAEPLLAPILRGNACWLTAPYCRNELARVLGYPEFKLTAERQAAICERYAALTACAGDHGPPAGPAVLRLPRCKDPDDQPFLELAAHHGAELLVTRDHALLRLGKRVQALDLPLRIVEPPQAVALFTQRGLLIAA